MRNSKLTPASLIKTNKVIDKLAARLTTKIGKALKLNNEQSVTVYEILRMELR